jgi:uncharacterized protein with von Willebrand factor type A (vWA) domain
MVSSEMEVFMKKRKTEVVMIIDDSGSMWDLKKDTIGGINSFLAQQRLLPKEDDVYITMVFFNNESKFIYSREKLENIKNISDINYVPGGATALYDAIGKTMQFIALVHAGIGAENVPEKCLCVIVTDGKENSSCEFTNKSVKAIITEKQRKGWEFIFLGANIMAENIAEEIGIRRERAVDWHADSEGEALLYDCMSDYVSGAREGVYCCDASSFAPLKRDFENRKKQ